jgi:hypothetical protein
LEQDCICRPSAAAPQRQRQALIGRWLPGEMVRGAAKAQAQAKNQKKSEAAKGGDSQLKHRAAALQFICPMCKVLMPNYGTVSSSICVLLLVLIIARCGETGR